MDNITFVTQPENITHMVDYYENITDISGYSENITDISNSSTIIAYTYRVILQMTMYFIYKML